MIWLAIGLGGSLGAISRYGVSQLLKAYTKYFPYATLLVNLVGSFLFGLVLGMEFDRESAGYLFFSAGFLGSFTTFSTFSYETMQLFNQKEFFKSFVYVTLHLLISISVAGLGYFIAYF